MIERRCLKMAVVFIQTILGFVLSRTIFFVGLVETFWEHHSEYGACADNYKPNDVRE